MATRSAGRDKVRPAAVGRASSGAARLSHVDSRGRVKMVDVGDKPVTVREAVASGEITMSAAALKSIRSGKVAKGDPLQTARLAGIMAAKETASLIPLCHPLPLSHVSVDLTPTRAGYRIQSRVRTSGQTGVEMEALTAVAVAALTIYDMVKAVDKRMVIGRICLLEKRGGRSGEFNRDPKSKVPNLESRSDSESQRNRVSRTRRKPQIKAST